MTYFYELNHTQLLALKGEEDLRKGSNMNGQVRKILKKCFSKLAVNCSLTCHIHPFEFYFIVPGLDKIRFLLRRIPVKFGLQKMKFLENLLPFYTFGIFLLAGRVRGEGSLKVRKEQETVRGVGSQPQADKALLQREGDC